MVGEELPRESVIASDEVRFLMARTVRKAMANATKEVMIAQDKTNASERAKEEMEKDMNQTLTELEQLKKKSNILESMDKDLDGREFATRIYHILKGILAKLVQEVDWEHYGVKCLIGVAVKAMLTHQNVQEESELTIVVTYPIERAQEQVQDLATKGMSAKELEKFGSLLITLFDKAQTLTFEMLLGWRNRLESLRNEGHIAAHTK